MPNILKTWGIYALNFSLLESNENSVLDMCNKLPVCRENGSTLR